MEVLKFLTLTDTNSEINLRMYVSPSKLHVWRTYICLDFCSLATHSGNKVKLQTLHYKLFYDIAPPAVRYYLIICQIMYQLQIMSHESY